MSNIVEHDPFDPTKGLDNPDDVEEREEEEKVEEEESELSAQIAEIADNLEKLAVLQINDSIVQDVVSAGLSAAENPYEGIEDPTSVSTRLQNIVNNRNAALRTLKPEAISEAHAAFLYNMFGIDVDGDGNTRANAADGLITQIIYAVKGQVLPETLKASDQAIINKLTQSINNMSDSGYWNRLSNFSGDAVTVDKLPEHLVFMGLTSQMRPMKPGETASTNDIFMWSDEATKATMIDQLIAASGASPADVNGRRDGTVDMVEMYRRAAALTVGGEAIPRGVVAELVRLAVGELVGGVKPKTRRSLTVSRDSAKIALKFETEKTAVDPVKAKARNDTRAAAMDLITATKNVDVINSNTQADTTGMRTKVRAARAELGNFNRRETAIVLDAVRRQKGGDKIANQIESLIKNTGLYEALDKWSEKYTSSERDPASLTESLTNLRQCLNMVNGALDQFYISAQVEAGFEEQRLKPIINETMVEVSYEASELINGFIIDVGTPLDSAELAVETATLFDRVRTAAKIARDTKNLQNTQLKISKQTPLSKFVDTQLKAYKNTAWYLDLKNATDAWATGERLDLKTLADATKLLVTTLGNMNVNSSTLPPDQQYFAQRIIDALAFVSSDRMQSLIDTGDPDALMYNFPELVTSLRDFQIKFEPVTSLVLAWTTAKENAKKLPDRSQSLTSLLSAWDNLVAIPSPDLIQLAEKTYLIVRAIQDYRVGIEKMDDKQPADIANKVRLLQTLDTMLYYMQSKIGRFKG